MLRLHMMQELEKYKNYEKYCSEEKVTKLKKIFDKCMENNNNKIDSCQELRNKLENCYSLLNIN